MTTPKTEIDACFFYGTLMHPKILSRVLLGPYHALSNGLDKLKISSAILLDYARHRIIGEDYPAVIENPGAHVRGSLVCGLNELDFMRLDAFEGEQYIRKLVRVQNGEKEIQAYTYVWSSYKSMLDKSSWDYNDFVRERLHNWIGTSGSENVMEYVDCDSVITNTNFPVRTREELS